MKGRFRSGWIALACAVLACTGGCREWRAERAFTKAVATERQRPGADVVVDLQRVVARWPATKAAAKARREIQWLGDLDESSRRGLGLLAWDAVRRVGAAVERFRAAQGRYPGQFDELVPRYLSGPVEDPWGHSVGYLRTARGYQVICYGSDGIPGGSGDASDVLVVDGRSIRYGGSVR